MLPMTNTENAKPPVLKCVFFIIDWSKTDVISQVFEQEHVRFHFLYKGKGTASSDILDLLGIGSTEKAVVMCLEQAVMVPVLLKEVSKKLGLHSPGAGIAFTIPLSGINSLILQVFKESVGKILETKPEKDRESMSNEIKNELIISIINHGYSDEFMASAREAGATGGTIISARGVAHKGPVRFFGISLQDEKEIIIIVAAREKKTAIMQAVSRSHGVNTKAGGIVFSLPVDGIMGLDLH
jgi:hypothetical protein